MLSQVLMLQVLLRFSIKEYENLFIMYIAENYFLNTILHKNLQCNKTKINK